MPKVGTREWNALLIKLEYNNDSVTSLSFYGDDIGNEGAITISRLLEGNYRVTSLKLTNNKVGDEGARALAKMLEENDTLTELKLDRNEISTEGVNAIGRALEKNQKLQSLILGVNKIGENIEFLGQGLRKNRGLKTLELNSNEIGSKGAEIVASALEENETLNTLNLSNNQIGNAGAIALGKCLEKNKALITVKLFTNQITTEGMGVLFLSLEENQTLKNLDLDNNKIDIESAKILAKSLGKNKTLASLSLNKNQINTESLQFLAAGFENCALTFLSLRNNQIDTTGAEHLSKVLKKNEMLKQLKLADNQIGDEGVEILCQALEENYTLTHLSLDNNQITTKGAQRLIQMFQKNHFLVSLELGAESPHNSNKIEQSEKQQIEALLKRNLSFKPGNVLDTSLNKEEEVTNVPKPMLSKETQPDPQEIKKPEKKRQNIISIPELCKKINESQLEKLDLAEATVPDYWSPEVKCYGNTMKPKDDYSATTVVKYTSQIPIRATSNGILHIGRKEENTIYVPGKTYINALAVLSSRFIASGSNKGIIHIWDLDNLKSSSLGLGSTNYVKAICTNPSRKILALAVLSNSQMVSLSGHPLKLEFLDVWSGKCISSMEISSISSIWGCESVLKIMGSKIIIAGSRDEGKKYVISIFDIEQKKHITDLEGHEDFIKTIELLPNSKLASLDRKNEVRIWQLDTFKCLRVLTHNNETDCLAVLPSGELAVGTESKVGIEPSISLPSYENVYKEERVAKHVGHAIIYTTEKKVVGKNYKGSYVVKEARDEYAPAIVVWNLDTFDNKTYNFESAKSTSSNKPIVHIDASMMGMLRCYKDWYWCDKDLSLFPPSRQLNSEELQTLLTTLKKNHSVIELSLSGIQLDESNVSTLTEVMQNNKFLEKIDLTGTHIEITDGALKLLEALKNNYSLIEITLDNNKEAEKLAIQFKEFLNRNKAKKSNIVSSQSGFFKNQQEIIKNQALVIAEKSISEYEKTAETKKSTHLGRAFSIFCFRFHLTNIKNDATKNAKDIEKLIDIAIQNMIDQKEFGSRGYEKSGFYKNLMVAKQELKDLFEVKQDASEAKQETFSA